MGPREEGTGSSVPTELVVRPEIKGQASTFHPVVFHLYCMPAHLTAEAVRLITMHSQ